MRFWGSAEPAVARLHLRRGLGWLRLCRVRDRRLCPIHSRLAGEPLDAHRTGALCAGAGTAFAPARLGSHLS